MSSSVVGRLIRDTLNGLRGRTLRNPFTNAEPVTLVRFNEAATVDSWLTQTDAKHGGSSTLRWLFHGREPRDDAAAAASGGGEPASSEGVGFAEFSGELSVELSDEMKQLGAVRSGYCAVVSPDKHGSFDLSCLGGVVLRAAGDSRQYVLNLHPYGFGEQRLLQCCFRVRPEWTTVYLPFSHFVKTWKGHVMDQPQVHTTDLEMITRVGILMAERKNGPFRLCIDSIRALPRSEFPQRRYRLQDEYADIAF